jgi:hypothetical protein
MNIVSYGAPAADRVGGREGGNSRLTWKMRIENKNWSFKKQNSESSDTSQIAID